MIPSRLTQSPTRQRAVIADSSKPQGAPASADAVRDWGRSL